MNLLHLGRRRSFRDLLWLLLCGGWVVGVSGASGPSPRPSFIVLLGEGAGWSSSSVMMDDRLPASRGEGVRTPQLERLASMGLRFSDAYAASPRCTPSRAALFTGRTPAALHMTFVGEGAGRGAAPAGSRVRPPQPLLELPESETTIGELLKRAGYATAHFGKWHVGRVSPSRHGFDENDGPTGNGGPDNVAQPNPKEALAMTARGIAFLERQAASGRPFYLQMSHYPDRAESGGRGGGGRRRDRASDDDVVDRTLGQVLDAVERLGLRESTYVLYTTDHGSPGRNPPLTGGKGNVGEGGLRVPFLIAGPGIPRGACSHVRVSALDVLPTLVELAGVPGPMPSGVEGGSLVPLWRVPGTATVRRPREEFVVHFPHHDKGTPGPASALWLGDLKLVRVYETGERHLYDLRKDLAEREDLAGRLPDKVADMDRRLTEYLRSVRAQMPEVVGREVRP